MGLLDFVNPTPERYSPEWITRLNDHALREEREWFRKNVYLRSSRQDACHNEAILHLFDREMSNRYRKTHPDTGRPMHPPREHGWYLPKMDCVIGDESVIPKITGGNANSLGEDGRVSAEIAAIKGSYCELGYEHMMTRLR